MLSLAALAVALNTTITPVPQGLAMTIDQELISNPSKIVAPAESISKTHITKNAALEEIQPLHQAEPELHTMQTDEIKIHKAEQAETKFHKAEKSLTKIHKPELAVAKIHKSEKVNVKLLKPQQVSQELLVAQIAAKNTAIKAGSAQSDADNEKILNKLDSKSLHKNDSSAEKLINSLKLIPDTDYYIPSGSLYHASIVTGVHGFNMDVTAVITGVVEFEVEPKVGGINARITENTAPTRLQGCQLIGKIYPNDRPVIAFRELSCKGEEGSASRTIVDAIVVDPRDRMVGLNGYKEGISANVPIDILFTSGAEVLALEKPVKIAKNQPSM